MSYVSTEAKVYSDSERFSAKRNANKAAARIDRTETSFGGKGCLTQNQYQKGMAQSKKRRKMSAW